MKLFVWGLIAVTFAYLFPSTPGPCKLTLEGSYGSTLLSWGRGRVGEMSGFLSL